MLESDTDLRSSEGLALIDDVSALLMHQRSLSEVRSATQPLGSPKPLGVPRLASRLGEVNDGFHQLSDGAGLLKKGLMEGAAKLRLAIWLEKKTGLSLTGKPIVASEPKSDAALNRARNRETMASGIKQASAVLQMSPAMPGPWNLPVLRHAFAAIKDSGKDSGEHERRPARTDRARSTTRPGRL